jgi:hypothetical protein
VADLRKRLWYSHLPGKSWNGLLLALTAIEKLAAASFAGRTSLESTRPSSEFGNLLQNPWFTRAWVFQEVVASELVDMRYAQCTIAYPEFYRACLSIDCYGLKGDMETINDVTFAIHTGSLHEKRHVEKNLEFPRMSLLSLLMFRENTQATDLRDKISHLLESRMTAIIQCCRLSIPKM